MINRPYQIRLYRSVKDTAQIVSICVTRIVRGSVKTKHYTPTPQRLNRIDTLVKETSSVKDKSQTFDYYAKWF